MKTTDAPSINQETQYELRKQVVRLKEKGELDNQAISEIVGLCPTHISTFWKKYQRCGLEAIKPKDRGRRFGEKRELTADQEADIQNDAYNVRGFAPKGKTPVVRINATKSRVNMISSITNRGKVRFMLYRETMTAQMLVTD